MVAAKNLSPGGALLRASRLFSVPPPIAPPPADLSDGVHYGSSSATLPFPTHQVVTAPESSRKRGDWGFKRAFPLKSTSKTSTPMISVRQVDSIEQITDFVSASNYGLTLRKFQELNIPVTMPASDDRTSRLLQGRSVFEEDGDFTAINPGKEKLATDKRWKFRGPWLAGMPAGEFQRWLSKSIRHRRPEFRQFLKKKIAADITKEKEVAAANEGGLGREAAELVDPKTISDEQVTEFLRKLRVDRQRLYDLVGEFLDLAPLLTPDVNQALGNLSYNFGVNLRVSDSPYAASGPPMTHPSAGISYLRTAGYLDNHPVYGPQANRAPVEGRIIAPRPNNGSVPATLGVGGFVPNIAGDNSLNMRDAKNVDLRRYNPATPGGPKVYVQATKATVNSRGRVILDIKQANMEDECVTKELIGKDKVFGQGRSFSEGPGASAGVMHRPIRGMGYSRSGPQRIFGSMSSKS